MISHKSQADGYSVVKVKSAKLASFTLEKSSCQNGNLIFRHSELRGKLPIWELTTSGV